MDDIEAELTAPGAPFELTEEVVLGERMPVFRQRPRSLRDLVEASRQFDGLDYLVFGEDRRLSFEEHRRAVASVAACMSERFGVRKGDRVAILAANCPEWIVSFWAAVSLGAIAVGMNGWWAGDEIRYALGDSKPKLLIADSKRLDRIERAALSVPFVEVEGDFDELWVYDPQPALPTEPIAEDDPAVILYTSGTTGKPKGAVCTHRSLLALLGVQGFHGARLLELARRAGMKLELPSPDEPLEERRRKQHVRLSSNPLFHVSGLSAGAVAHLATGVRSVWTTGKYDPLQVLRLIEREGVNGWGPMGAMAYRLLNHPERDQYDLTSVTSIGCGGAPVTPETQAALREAFPSAQQGLAVGYGLTECGALATLAWGPELSEDPDTVGAPLPSVAVQIRDEHGKPVDEGHVGEVCVRSPLVMKEYWNDPEATAAVFWPGRWLRTGDIGTFRNGRLYIATRERDLILRGAENVYPAEIEARLDAHPDVHECAVVGVDSAEFGQEVKAVVVPEPGRELDPETLRAWVAEALAYYKVPAHWEVRQEPLPRNASNKIMKYVLTGGSSPLISD